MTTMIMSDKNYNNTKEKIQIIKKKLKFLIYFVI